MLHEGARLARPRLNATQALSLLAEEVDVFEGDGGETASSHAGARRSVLTLASSLVAPDPRT